MDDVQIREAKPSEYEEMITFFDNYFVPGEPMHNMLNLIPEEGFRMPYWDAWLRVRLQHPGLHYVAYNKENEMVGAIIAHYLTGDEEIVEPVQPEEDKTKRMTKKVWSNPQCSRGSGGRSSKKGPKTK